MDKNIQFVHITSIIEPDGTFIIINPHINHKPLTVANIYCSNNGPSTARNFFFCTMWLNNFQNG